MSYHSSATIFYGVIINEEKIENSFKSNESLENLLDKQGLHLVTIGNLLSGDVVYGICVASIETSEHRKKLNQTFFEISDNESDNLNNFLKEHNIESNPSWFLGASYG